MGDVDALLSRGALRQVPADADEAVALLAAARRHLQAANRVVEIDPAGAYTLAYDAARKAVTAHLAAHGLAVRSRTGAHAVIADYALALGDGRVFGSLDRMRRNRNQAQYGSREFSQSEVRTDIVKADAIVVAVGGLLDLG